MKKIKVKEGHPFLKVGTEFIINNDVPGPGVYFVQSISRKDLYVNDLSISQDHVDNNTDLFEDIPERIALDVTHIVNNEGNHGYEISRKDNKRLEISDFHKFEQSINGELKSVKQASEYLDIEFDKLATIEYAAIRNFIEEFFSK